MSKLYLLANSFLKAVASSDLKTEAAGRPLSVKVTSGRKNRRQLEKDLAQAKDRYSKTRTSLEAHQRTARDLAAIIERESYEVEKTRADINRAYDVLRNMDLHDVNEIRFIGDDVGYIKNRRIYRLNDSDMVPFKKKMELDNVDAPSEKPSELLGGLPDESSDAAYDFTADDLLASLVDDE